ncbi:MAG: phosphatidate cytidylyltransferase [Gaiellales bacterium]
MSALGSRILVAVALLPIVLGVVYLGGWWLAALATVGGLLALHELYTMGRSLRPIVLAGFLGLALTVLTAHGGGLAWLLGGIMATVGACFLLFLGGGARQHATSGFALTTLGVVWVGGGLAHLVAIRDIPDDGLLLLVTVLLTVFADDTGAYTVGRMIGRHRLAPSISPGKSWEGFLGGTLAGVAVAFFSLYDQDVLTIGESLVFGLAICLASTLGDLFESAVKRDLGVKDSGRMLGGHGGVLDRVDSLLWAGPAAFYALLLLT